MLRKDACDSFLGSPALIAEYQTALPDKQGRYYKAILQNLFFATLNTPADERKFRSARSYQGKNKHYGDQRYFRHVGLFHEKAPVEELYKSIPFLNGGLFEMLDEIPGRGDDSITEEKRVDGFSDVADKQPLVPDFLFFGDERPVPELSALLGESTAPKARGLLKIFRDYKFTIEENTPLEQERSKGQVIRRFALLAIHFLTLAHTGLSRLAQFKHQVCRAGKGRAVRGFVARGFNADLPPLPVIC